MRSENSAYRWALPALGIFLLARLAFYNLVTDTFHGRLQVIQADPFRVKADGGLPGR